MVAVSLKFHVEQLFQRWPASGHQPVSFHKLGSLFFLAKLDVDFPGYVLNVISV